MLLFKSLFSLLLLLQVQTAAAYYNAAYFAAWTGWSGFTPSKLPGNQLSHVIYAFAKITSNGTVIPGDMDIDYKVLYDGDVRESGNNAYGNVKQLYLLKKQNRKLKTLLSIGGYDASQKGDFDNASKTTNHRIRFCDSVIKLMLDYGMDGIDLDWEYPASTTQHNNFIKLINDLRAALDKKSAALGQNYKYLLTAATPAGPSEYNKFQLSKMNSKLDFFNLMSYDFSGLWSPVTAHNSNLYPDKNNLKATPFSTEGAVNDYIAKGVTPRKINVGIPLYGRSFAQTSGLGQSFKGTLASNSDGTIPYNQLPKKGATVTNRSTPGAVSTYDSSTKELVVLDTDYSAKLKATFIKKLGLGGSFFWEASGDKTGSKSLISVLKSQLGSLDATNNQLSYPSSEFLNIRQGMPSRRKRMEWTA